jgi:hypothetical protein
VGKRAEFFGQLDHRFQCRGQADPIPPRHNNDEGTRLRMAVIDARDAALASSRPPVNTDIATCGHRACKAFTGASAALKSSLAGVAVVTRPRAPGPARSGRSTRPVTAPVNVRAPEWTRPPLRWLQSHRHALRKQRHARRRARPRSKDRGPSFHGETQPPWAVARHPVASTHPGRSIPNGEPCSPMGTTFPFPSRRRTTMSASQATRVPRSVGVLLGGSGRVRAPDLPPPRLAALLRPAEA